MEVQFMFAFLDFVGMTADERKRIIAIKILAIVSSVLILCGINNYIVSLPFLLIYLLEVFVEMALSQIMLKIQRSFEELVKDEKEWT